jgi:hypothetical protein
MGAEKRLSLAGGFVDESSILRIETALKWQFCE